MKKIREKLKRFQVSEKGFTLIELIVVIAIIGILAAIGTVAYSGYIESANQAADEQLAYDVSYAIQLGAADEGITDNETEYGYVVLTADKMYLDGFSDGDTDTGDSSGEAETDAYDGVSYYAQTLAVDYGTLSASDKETMTKTWLSDGVGSDWESQVLKSDLYTTGSDTVRVAVPTGTIYWPEETGSTLSTTISANLTNYASSSYAGNEESLMESVEGVSSTFGSLVESFAAYTEDGTLSSGLALLLGYGDGYTGEITDEEGWTEFLASYGITLEDGEDLTAEEAGNLMVLAMASALTDTYTTDGEIDSTAISELVSDIVTSTKYTISDFYSSDTYEELTALFGAATAYYLSGSASSDFSSTYESTIESLAGSTSATKAAMSLQSLVSAFEKEITEDNTYYSNGTLASDTTAFISLMSVLTESYESGDFDFDLDSMSWDSSSSSDVYSYLIDLMSEYGISLE